MIMPTRPCCNCGGTARGETGDEIVYLASKGIDEPWFCIKCRRHF